MEGWQFLIFWLLGMAVSTVFGSWIVRNHRNLGYMVFSAMLAIYIVSANILVPRLVNFNIFGASFVLVTGSIIWPYTSQLGDMINEIYGKKYTYWAAAVGYVANLMFVGFTLMAFNLPPLWDAQAEGFFQNFFGLAFRVVVASICSYTASNLIDINTFARFKKWTMEHERGILSMLLFSSGRSAVSDALAMVVDNIVFYTIAFAGTMPTDALVTLIVSSGVAKVILSQVDLPFFWAFKLMTRGVQRDL